MNMNKKTDFVLREVLPGVSGMKGPCKIYLAGPIGQVSFDTSVTWRKKATEALREKGIEVEDPTERMNLPTDVIVNGDKEAIRRCRCILAYAPKGVAFVGTSMEIFYGCEVLKIPVVTWGEGNGTDPSPWIVMHSVFVCESLDEALNAITEKVFQAV